MISILKISKGNNSAKNEGGVTVLISARCLIMVYIVPSFVKLSRTVSKVWSGHECSTSDGRTDGRTDTQKFRGYNIIPRHFLWRDIKGEYLWQYLMHSALNLISTFLYGKETVYQISSP